MFSLELVFIVTMLFIHVSAGKKAKIIHFLFSFSKSLSPIFFSIRDEKLSHPWIQIQKKTIKFFTPSMGFDRKKIKI